MSELPDDLLDEILCHVPATSLKRLRSTCKRWNRLFNYKRFTRKHFDKATKQFLFLTLKESRVCSMSINLQKDPSLELVGELTLFRPRSSLDQTEICEVSHCDGLLLCVTKEYDTRLVVWNPFNGQTRWIINYHKLYTKYALGSYQDKNSNDHISYKILSHTWGYGNEEEFKIYEINSNSWRILDVTIDFNIRGFLNRGVSLKGKTYWIARDQKKEPLLVSFDYTTERFERLCLPCQYPSYQSLYLSVVREEKLSVLLQGDGTSKTEIWVTNKIGEETKVVSWRMVLSLDLRPRVFTWNGGSFWIDEEKKVFVCCDNVLYKGKYKKTHIVGEENKVRTEDLEVGSSTWPVLLNYAPSLIQIGG